MGPRRATHSTQLVPEPVSLSDQQGMLLCFQVWHNVGHIQSAMCREPAPSILQEFMSESATGNTGMCWVNRSVHGCKGHGRVDITVRTHGAHVCVCRAETWSLKPATTEGENMRKVVCRLRTIT